jgi:AraC-like DNA-binding protein
VATLAGLAQLSPYHFSRAFRQSFGMPPHRYHINRRIERAKCLLANFSLSITEIGQRLGFKCFRRYLPQGCRTHAERFPPHTGIAAL